MKLEKCVNNHGNTTSYKKFYGQIRETILNKKFNVEIDYLSFDRGMAYLYIKLQNKTVYFDCFDAQDLHDVCHKDSIISIKGDRNILTKAN